MSAQPRKPQELEEAAIQAYHNGEYRAAEAHFLEAQATYRSAGNVLKAAEVANNLSVLYLKMNRVDEALEAVKDTPPVFEDAGEANLAAQAFGNLASALEANSRLEEAESAYLEAAGRFEALGNWEDYAFTMKELSRIQLRLQRPLEALSSMQTGLHASPKKGVRQRILEKLLNLPSRLLRP